MCRAGTWCSRAGFPSRLERELERHVLSGFGIDTRVLVRTRDELAAVVELNPLGDVADDPKRYQVSFLSAEPAAEAIDEIAAVDVAPERFAHHGREIYAWHPQGIHASALAKLISDRRLGVTATARNWKHRHDAAGDGGRMTLGSWAGIGCRRWRRTRSPRCRSRPTRPRPTSSRSRTSSSVTARRR